MFLNQALSEHRRMRMAYRHHFGALSQGRGFDNNQKTTQECPQRIIRSVAVPFEVMSEGIKRKAVKQRLSENGTLARQPVRVIFIVWLGEDQLRHKFFAVGADALQRKKVLDQI